MDTNTCPQCGQNLRQKNAGNKLARATNMIRDELSKGPQPAAALERAARTAGISSATLDRARKIVGVIATQESDFLRNTFWMVRLGEKASLIL